MCVPFFQSFTVVGHRYQSLADYHAVDVGELSVGEGQIVEVVKVSKDVVFFFCHSCSCFFLYFLCLLSLCDFYVHETKKKKQLALLW